MEEEHQNQLPFLDVKVTKDNNNKLQTSVYRKPTHTDQYLHFTSHHPLQVKTGIIATLARRARNICSTQDSLETELNHLRHVFTHFNDYPPELVNKTIQNTLNPPPKPPRQQTAPFTISLPYIGPASHQIRRLLKHQANIDAVFQKGRNIQNILQATGRPPSTTKQHPSGVVYQIECDCGETYVGETSRPLPLRIKEHQSSVQKNDSKSAISDHAQAHPNHNIQWNNIKILERNQSDFYVRKFLEAIHIKRLNPIINRDQGYVVPLPYQNLINSQSAIVHQSTRLKNGS